MFLTFNQLNFIELTLINNTVCAPWIVQEAQNVSCVSWELSVAAAQHIGDECSNIPNGQVAIPVHVCSIKVDV